MAAQEHQPDNPKSLADVLAEEMDGKAGDAHTQQLPAAEKHALLEAVYRRIHALEPKRSALCLSGGGIRSATFGLGVLQGLARHDLLGQFDYLSTVSGGGYVGGWLSAWIKHHPGGTQGVIEELKRRPSSPLNPEPEAIRHLRTFSNYLTPKTGFFSADAWTLVATFLRNMVLNWLVIISWLAAAMMIPRLYLATVLLKPPYWKEKWALEWPGLANSAKEYGVRKYAESVAWYDFWLNIVLGVAFVLIAMAMAYAVRDVQSTGNVKWPQSRFLRFRQVPLLLAALLLAGWWSVFCNIHTGNRFDSWEGLYAFIAFFILSYLIGGLIGGRSLAPRKTKTPTRPRAEAFFRLAAIIFTSVLGGACLWLIAIRVFPRPADNDINSINYYWINYVCFAPSMILCVLLLVNFLFVGFASRISQDEDREWWGRSAAWFLITIFAWSAMNTVVFWGAQLITEPEKGNPIGAFFGSPKIKPYANVILAAFGGVTGIVGALLRLRSKLASEVGSRKPAQWPLVLASIAFFGLLSVITSWALLHIGSTGTDLVFGELRDPDYQGPFIGVFLLIFFNALLGAVMGFFINVNKFSLHGTYRMRLIRAFLGASRPNADRNPHLFTGFDPTDDIKMCDLSVEKPFHVVNAALNLVKGEQLAWQERKAESFTVTRLHSGSWRLGYRPSEKYGDTISLGTALTISGAAANPNSGYQSSPLVGFLMTLFNVRLGCWLGNPGVAGARTWQRAGPSYSVGPLFAEAMGDTTDTYKYVNLSDGGHFENLGLYEMVLRRCHFIVLVDSGHDTDYVYEDLGNAFRKIRIDFGITIDIKVVSPKKAAGVVHHCAFGRIGYSAIDGGDTDGFLIYIKPVLTGDESADISNYASAHPEFPHEPTTDQWFSESQFESYRLLGLHATEAICGNEWKAKTLGDFFEQIKSDMLQTETAKEKPF